MGTWYSTYFIPIPGVHRPTVYAGNDSDMCQQSGQLQMSPWRQQRQGAHAVPGDRGEDGGV